MENLLFLGVPILKHIKKNQISVSFRSNPTEYVYISDLCKHDIC